MDIFSGQFGGYVLQILQGGLITIKLFMSGFVLALTLGMIVGIVSSVSPMVRPYAVNGPDPDGSL